MVGPIGDSSLDLYSWLGSAQAEEITSEHVTKVQTEPGLSGVRDSIAQAQPVDGQPYFAFATPDNPVIPPGTSNTPIEDVLLSYTSEASQMSLQELVGDLPPGLKEMINLPPHVAGPMIQGMKEGLMDIAALSGAAKEYLAGVEGAPPPPSLAEQISGMNFSQAGPIDPKSSPEQQNTQMFINSIDTTNNAVQIAKADVQAMPEGAGSDSYSAFLQRVDVVLAELREVLGQIQQGAGSLGKESMGKSSITEVKDWNVSLADKLDEMRAAREKKTNFLGNILGPLADFFDTPVLKYFLPGGGISLLQDILPEQLAGMMEFFNVFTMSGGLRAAQTYVEGDMMNMILNGQFGQLIETTITDFKENPEMLVGAAIAVVVGSVLTAFLGPLGPIAQIAVMALLVYVGAGMASGKKTMIGRHFNSLPMVGDLLGKGGLGGMVQDVIDPITSAIGLNKLFGNPEPGEDAVKARIEARRAAQTSANGAVGKAASKRISEEDGLADEDADLIAAIQQLIRLLTSIKNGSTSPELLAGQIEAAIKTVMNADMEGLEGAGDFAKQLGGAADAISEGDYDEMLDELSSAFGEFGVELSEEQAKEQERLVSEELAPVITNHAAAPDPNIAFSELNNAA